MTVSTNIAPAVTSIAVSIIASIAATWLLRRVTFLTEQPGGNPEGGQRSAVIVVAPMLIGNTVGSQFYLRRRGPFGKMRRMLGGGNLRER